MDFSSILTVLRNGAFNPITYIFLGLAFIYMPYYMPYWDWDTKWLGVLLLIIGGCQIGESIYGFIKNKCKNWQYRRDCRRELKELQKHELEFLKVLLAHNKRTFDRDDILMHLNNPRQDNNVSNEQLIEALFDHRKSVAERLSDLLILSVTHNGYEIREEYWNILKKDYPDIFNTRALCFRDSLK